jgi:hypothetical protein
MGNQHPRGASKLEKFEARGCIRNRSAMIPRPAGPGNQDLGKSVARVTTTRQERAVPALMLRTSSVSRGRSVGQLTIS